MHKEDNMTPNERLSAFFEKREIDRLPTMPFLDSVGGKVAGMTHREKRSCAKNQAEAQIVCYERFGHDSMSIEYGLHGVGVALGSTLSDPEDAVPAVIEHCLKSLNNIGSLDIERVSKRHDPWAMLNYEAMQICQDKWGHEVGVSVGLPGPFTAAASLYPMDNLLRSTRKEPEKVHELLRFCTDAVKILIEEFTDTGADIFLCDPIASGTTINQNTYRQFVLPYTKELADCVHKSGVSMGYHICGNTTNITSDMTESGCDFLSVDNQVDLKMAIDTAGKKMPIIGNVDPINVMMFGTFSEIDEAVLDCLDKARDCPCGYIVSTGCDIPLNAPVENIDRFMQAVRKYTRCLSNS